MRYRELIEMPISDIKLVGPYRKPFDQGTAFDPIDRAILQSPKGRDKIIRMFSKTPHIFEVIFINGRMFSGSDPRKNNDEVDDIAKTYNAGIHDTFKGYKGKEGVIRVIQIGNLSPLVNKGKKFKMPMTGWTLAHKIGHSLQDNVRRGTHLDIIQKVLVVDNALVDFFQGRSTKYRNRYPQFRYGGDAAMKGLTMKSARTGMLSNNFEVFAEVVAQYLITGKVTLKNYNIRKRRTPNTHEFVPVAAAQKIINAALDDLFQSLHGKILVEI